MNPTYNYKDENIKIKGPNWNLTIIIGTKEVDKLREIVVILKTWSEIYTFFINFRSQLLITKKEKKKITTWGWQMSITEDINPKKNTTF